MPRTHYDVLRVDRDASSVDIAAAFRERMAELGEKAQASPESLAAVREAYQVLGTPERRREYDERTAPAVRPAAARRRGPDPADADAPRRSLATYAIPAGIFAVALIGWKMSGPRHAPAVIEERTITFSQAAAPVPMPPPPRAAAEEAPVAAASTAGISAADLFASVSPSVVRVSTAGTGGRRLGQGSGVVVEAGQVITNCHVTRGAQAITVHSAAGALEASVEVADEHFDLCLLRVPGLDAPAATVAGASGLRTGERVYAIGSPMGLELSLSEGIVAALREVKDGQVIQTTAPVSPGSSGGGLFDAGGQLVGIVTFQHRFGQNLNFAVPADWIAQMRDRRAPARPQPVAAEREPTDAERILGRWYCFGNFTGRNGEYDFRPDGTVAITMAGGEAAVARYALGNRKLRYSGGRESLTLTVEVLTDERMVQLAGEGRRIACDRR